MRKLIAFASLACLAVAVRPVFAGIESTTGGVVEVSPPTSVAMGHTESDTDIIAFAEKQKFQLTSDLQVDICDAGMYTGPSATLTPGTISAGTLVNSYLLHFDPEHGGVDCSGSVTFEEPILGLIVLDEEPYRTLNKSDFLGASETFYPDNYCRRMELIVNNPKDPQDQVILSADRKTVTITALTNASCQDQVRIITKVTQYVDIDIKPGSFPNSINPNAGGVIPVAILTTDTFDASTVDPATVALAGVLARGKGKSGNHGSMEDVDGDGDLDLVVQIVNDINWEENATEATLTGMTWDGIPIEGTDSVRIVPPEQ